jgi:hypothetical protein
MSARNALAEYRDFEGAITEGEYGAGTRVGRAG